MGGKIIVIAGGQYGSEGKGLIAGYLSQWEERPLMAVRVGGPNAGHTVWSDGQEFKFQSLPVAAVMRPNSRLIIAAGSEVEQGQLDKERDWVADLDIQERLLVDGQATIIDPSHQGFHDSSNKYGGTGKGTNRARAARAVRDAELVYSWEGMPGAPQIGDTTSVMRQWLQNDGCVLIEGTQGYGLGTHAGEYPFCTGNDCTAIDFLAMCGLSPWAPYVEEFEPWVVYRTYPIRVSGNSGPFHAGELTWEELAERHGAHIRPEQTTVTKKTRRVGEWDKQLAQDSMIANGGRIRAALTFFDYVMPKVEGITGHINRGRDLTIGEGVRLAGYEQDIGARIDLVGTGPTSVMDFR
jgi:adenylosuccinate synthase